MRLALAQVNPTVGDVAGNIGLVLEWLERARAAGADLVAFPEMVISGYPPEDLLLRSHFVERCEAALEEVAAGSRGMVAVVGAPVRPRGGSVAPAGPPVANGAAVLAQGRVAALYEKIHLPNYAVFDEERYFSPGESVLVLAQGDARFAVNVCEDIWNPCGPTEAAALRGGARLVVNISMSPYHVGKGAEREAMIRRRAKDAGAFVAYVNGVGGQDELVFDGHSVVVGPDGTVVARGVQFEEQLIVIDLDLDAADRYPGTGTAPGSLHLRTVDLPAAGLPLVDLSAAGQPGKGATDGSSAAGWPAAVEPPMAPLLSRAAEVYGALCLGVHDYVRKNGFERVVIGLSGGIDSALTACIAVDALGAEAVTGVTMPSRYSSEGTRSDALVLAANLGMECLELPIEGLLVPYLETLAPIFGDLPADATEENLQARIRGNLLMALSNKFGWMVLATGNKSEMAVGYATLYGDMAGGFAVIKDTPKTMVYELARYRNSRESDTSTPIPVSTIERAPSAELRPDQTDQDSLPPYDLLDRIIEAYVVHDQSVAEMKAAGLDAAEVERVVAMIDRNEYKRRQAAPGVRITSKGFGKDRRLPITNRYRG